jgi:hypothetical protein
LRNIQRAPIKARFQRLIDEYNEIGSLQAT